MPLNVTQDKVPTHCTLCGRPQDKATYAGQEAAWVEFTHSGICGPCQGDLFIEHTEKGGR